MDIKFTIEDILEEFGEKIDKKDIYKLRGGDKFFIGGGCEAWGWGQEIPENISICTPYNIEER